MGADSAESFMRLFMVPGMHHCAGGAGPSDFGQGGPSPESADPESSLSTALQLWVEEGRAPEQVIARQLPLPGSAEQEALPTGLICAWPQQAALMSDGDPLRAESYQCRAP
jgi:feruloyl esterase